MLQILKEGSEILAECKTKTRQRAPCFEINQAARELPKIPACQPAACHAMQRGSVKQKNVAKYQIWQGNENSQFFQQICGPMMTAWKFWPRVNLRQRRCQNMTESSANKSFMPTILYAIYRYRSICYKSRVLLKASQDTLSLNL